MRILCEELLRLTKSASSYWIMCLEFDDEETDRLLAAADEHLVDVVEETQPATLPETLGTVGRTLTKDMPMPVLGGWQPRRRAEGNCGRERKSMLGALSCRYFTCRYIYISSDRSSINPIMLPYNQSSIGPILSIQWWKEWCKAVLAAARCIALSN